MDPQIRLQPLDKFRSLQTILCCPETKTPLRLVEIEELSSSLTDEGRKRIPAGTIGAFIAGDLQRAYPFSERVVNFLEDV
jgi:uncharacterized protein YbaR (Trm112 family)